MQVLTAGVGFNTSGNQVIVPAVAGSQILLQAVGLIINGATTITFNSQEGTFGPFIFPAAGTLTLDDYNLSAPYAEFAAGTGLVINSSNAVQVSGFLRYSLG